ncbi:MAG TPA: flagellar basal body rod protein FlgB [Methylococcaceae bacterium]|nr:flagellar basal body rod protein FlgB [Methylococcaceae bacterium]HIO13458.1 flagellar basal body rod protein FlgB [Methylococcales bacterium]HIO45653.1 flagellar basal body rod protein FlgB [Methylococcales bacterium]
MKILHNVLGVHEQALNLRQMRSTVLASNIANADTPHYQARDFNFYTLLNDMETQSIRSTHNHHIDFSKNALDLGLKYRIPTIPSIDGNTVESDTENNLFADNSMRYQATLTFLNQRIRGVLTALKGE